MVDKASSLSNATKGIKISLVNPSIDASRSKVGRSSTAVPAIMTSGARATSRRDRTSAKTSSRHNLQSMPQRDNNQSALEQEHVDVVRNAVEWLRAQDDTQELDDYLIYNSCEYWDVSSWSDRLFYKALEQVLRSSPPGTGVKLSAGGRGNKIRSKKKNTKKRLMVEEEQPEQQQQHSGDAHAGDQCSSADAKAQAGLNYDVHAASLQNVVVKLSATGISPQDMSKAEVCAQVQEHSSSWPAGNFDDFTFDSVWLDLIGDRDSVAQFEDTELEQGTTGTLRFSPTSTERIFERDGAVQLQQHDAANPVGILRQQQQPPVNAVGQSKIDAAIAEILKEDQILVPDPDAKPLEKLQQLLALRELTAGKTAQASTKSMDLNVKLPTHLHNYFDFSGDKDVLDFLNDLDDWFAMIPVAKHLPYFMLALASDIRKEWRIYFQKHGQQLTYQDARQWLMDKCLERNSVDKLLERVHSMTQKKGETMKQYTARATTLCAELERHDVRLDDAIVRKYFVDGAHKQIAEKVRAQSDFRALGLPELYDRMDALWVASDESSHDFRVLDEAANDDEDSDDAAKPLRKKRRRGTRGGRVKRTAATVEQVTEIVNAAFQGKGKGKNKTGQQGRGNGKKLPEYARMGHMKQFYSDKEWKERFALWKKKESPADHPHLYKKDRWKDKDGGEQYCCFKCRSLGHTMDRCKQFK
jgi:hypothetical protein